MRRWSSCRPAIPVTPTPARWSSWATRWARRWGPAWWRPIRDATAASSWSRAGAAVSPAGRRRFARLGGQRVLYACGTSNCAKSAARSVEALRKAGVQAAVAHAAGAGHTYRGEVAEKIHRSFAWLVDGDARWQGRSSAQSGGG